MPNILRLLPPVGQKVAKYYGRLREYSLYPYRYPLDLRYRLTHDLALSLLKSFRIRFVFRGLENAGSERAVFAFNHQSDFDPVVIMMILNRKCGYLAKKAISQFPIIKHVVNSTDGQYLDRFNLRQEVRAIRSIGDSLTRDPEMGFVIFPEGKRSQDPVFRTMSEFKPGAFKAAYYGEADIVPVCLYGTYETLEFSKRDKRVYPIQITFLPRIKYEEYKRMSTVELSARIQQAMEVEVDRMRKLQKPLEEYWNRPENAREVRKDNARRIREYMKSHKETRKADRKLAEECRREIPKGAPFKPVEYTREDKVNDRKSKAERHAEKREFLRRYREEGII